jgi:hypothetical protein
VTTRVVYPTRSHLAESAGRIEKLIAADMAADPQQFEGAALLQAKDAADKAAFDRFMARVKHVSGE